MKMWNRVLALLLVLCMVLSQSPLQVFAGEADSVPENPPPMRRMAEILLPEGEKLPDADPDPAPNGELPDPVPGENDPVDPAPGGDTDPQPTVYGSFAWDDPEHRLNEQGRLVLEGVSAENRYTLETVRSLLPQSLTLEDGKTVAISRWSCDAYIAVTEGNWPLSGEFVFAAALAEEILFAETAPAQQISVVLAAAPADRGTHDGADPEGNLPGGENSGEGTSVPGEGTSQPIVNETVYDGFTWNDASGVLSDGVFYLPTISSDNQIDFDSLAEMLPPSIILEDGRKVAVTWACDTFLEDQNGSWPFTGDHVFKATPAEEVSFSEMAPRREILVQLSNEVSMLMNGVSYVDAQGNPWTADNVTEITDVSTDLAEGWYVVEETHKIDQRITTSGNVNLILADGGQLLAAQGINVPGDASLTIWGQSGNTGKLIAAGDTDGKTEIGNSVVAAIGGNNSALTGIIIINGGIVNAASVHGGAIGGGASGDNIGEITINGGTVNATSNGSGAAIGGGANGDNIGEITINGGTVNAVSNGNGAAIGSGIGPAGIITINGGTVNATSNGYGAGIGGGSEGNFGGFGGTVIISGGTVTATSTIGPGIGGGEGRYKSGDPGSFTTSNSEGTNGSAFITAKSILDQGSQSSWSGIISDDNGITYTVYGTQNWNKIGLLTELTIDSNAVLKVANTADLKGATVSNHGTIDVPNAAEYAKLKDMNIGGPGKISIAGNQIYTVTTNNEASNVTVTADGAAIAGTDYTFKVVPNDNKKVFVFFQSGEGMAITLTGNNNEYTIPGGKINNNVTITVCNVPAPPAVNINYTEETLYTTAGIAWAPDSDENWQPCTADMAATAFGWNGSADVKVRFRAAADGKIQNLTIPARPTAPAALEIVEITGNRAALRPITGEGKTAQYSMDGITWQEDVIFSGLTEAAEYTFYARFKADDTSFASDACSVYAAQTTYKDPSGTEQSVFAKPLTNQTELTAGWYVVEGNQTITGPVNIDSTNGEVNIILADAATLSVQGQVNGGKLTLWGQSAGTGTLSVLEKCAQKMTFHAVSIGMLTVNGGNLNATHQNPYEELSGDGIIVDSLHIRSGSVTGQGGDVGLKIINGMDINAYYFTNCAIAGGKVTGIGNQKGVYIDGLVSVTGGELYGEATNQTGQGTGISLSGGEVSGGRMEGKAKLPESADEPFYGIFLPDGSDSLDITGGTLKGSTVRMGPLSIYVSKGIVIDGKKTAVHDSVTLTDEIKNIAADQSLTVAAGATLTVPSDMTLTNNGTLTNYGTIINEGTVTGNGKFYKGVPAESDIQAPAKVNDSMVYTGTAYAQKADFTLDAGNDFNCKWELEGWEGTLTKDGDTATEVRDAGTYAITFSKTGETATLTKSYTVTPATIAGDIADVELVYNGKDQTVNVTSLKTVNNQPLTIKYGTAAGSCSLDAITVKDASSATYYYKATAPNHADRTGSFTVTVKQFATEFEGSAKAYNGATETNTFTYGDTITVKAKPNFTGVIPVGMAVMRFALTEPTPNQMALYVEDTQISAAVSAGPDGVYEMTLNTADADVAELLIPGQTTAVTVKYAGTVNMADYAEILQLKVNKLRGTASVTIAGWTYGETANEPVPMSTTNGTTSVTCTYTAKGTDSFAEEVPTNAGTYTVKAAFPAADLYESCTATADFQIAKASYDMTGVEFKDAERVYNGEVQNPVISGKLPVGKDGKSVTVTYEGGIADVGTSTVTAKYATDSQNYNVPAAMTAELTITAAPMTAVTVPSITAPAAGTAPQTEIPDNGTHWSAAITWTPAIRDGFDFNTVYTANVTLKPDSNHSFTQDTLASSGLTGAKLNADGTITVTITYPVTRRAKIQSVTLPQNQDVTAVTAEGAMAELPKTVTITAEDGTTSLPITWELVGSYDPTPKAENIFKWIAEPGDLEENGQSLTGTVQTTNIGNVLQTEDPALTGQSGAWVDGIYVPVTKTPNGTYLVLPGDDCRSLVTYTYNSTGGDPHTEYPTGMQVWLLKKADGVYQATRVQELDNLLTYAGCSIRLKGNNGIRMITAVDKGIKSALINQGYAGCKLLEYGTVMAWTENLGGQNPVLGGPDCKSNYAYKKGVADPVFRRVNGQIQYTNVLVGFSMEDCSREISMRPYILLEDENGQQIPIYGGTIQRSIGYVAYQNRNAFPKGSPESDYVWNIIHHVYGNQFD